MKELTLMAKHISKALFIWATTILFSKAHAQFRSFDEFLAQVNTANDSLSKSLLIDAYLSKAKAPVLEDTKVHFIYRGKADSVLIPGEFNGWNPSKTKMQRLPKTNFFYHTENIPVGGRLEYKFLVDGSWILDPLNRKRAAGGFGENSDIWHPAYIPPSDIEYQRRVPRGTLDTLNIESKFLGRTHPVMVYVPPETGNNRRLPVIYVTDGGEYLTLGKMNVVLDNLIFEQKILPVIAVFIDPRTDIENNSSNQRMTDYAASDHYLDFLENELAPEIERNYPASRKANERLIIGASMGGLIATYAVMLRSHFIKNCAAQSPAYLQADSAVIKLFDQVVKLDINVYMDTGTMNDTENEARLVHEKLLEKGVKVHFAEYPEGHNWSNWRARLDDILEYFFAR